MRGDEYTSQRGLVPFFSFQKQPEREKTAKEMEHSINNRCRSGKGFQSLLTSKHRINH